MKYIISESLLNKAIQTYLNDYYGNLEKRRDKDKVHIEMWLDGSDIVFYYNGRKGIFAVSNYFYETLKNMFSLSDEDSKKIVKNWIVSNLDADPSIEVVTFMEAALRGVF